MSDYELPTPSPGTNRAAPPTRCRVCGGDRFVTVNLRSPEQTLWMTEHGITANPREFIEEVAPCYECNLAAYETLRGLRMDPAKAKQLHQAR